MRALLVLALAALPAIAACQTPEQMAAADDQTCRSYGANPGSDAYMACRLQQQRLRADEDLRFRQGMAALGQQMQAQNQPPRIVNCTSSRMGNYVNTSCY
ncbi:hypothetical protein [Roseibium sp.]|uniref:hypothetical protein n=1 Tax=Roseibium sp. TaxID=1936156 RepID=UPI00328F1A45